MRRVNVRLEVEEGSGDIDVLVTAPARDAQVEALMARIADPLAGTVPVLDDGGIAIPLPEEQIVSISADNKKLRIRTEDASYRVRSSLLDIEKRLNPASFLRISRYEIINLRKVRHFDFSISGALRIEMEDGSETWASRRYIRAIRDRLQGRGE